MNLHEKINLRSWYDGILIKGEYSTGVRNGIEYFTPNRNFLLLPYLTGFIKEGKYDEPKPRDYFLRPWPSSIITRKDTCNTPEFCPPTHRSDWCEGCKHYYQLKH